MSAMKKRTHFMNIMSAGAAKAFAAMALICAAGSAYAANSDAFNFNNTSGDFGDTTSKMEELANFVFYVMYLVGGVALTGAAFKLKQGDVPGFAKMAAGAGVMFIIPTLMRSLNQFSD